MKTSTKTTILAISVAVAIAGGGVAFKNYEIEKEHASLMETLAQSEKSLESKDKEIKKIRLLTKQQGYPNDVAAWTYKLDTFPPSKERTALAEHIIKVLEDNEITDAEYNALKNEMADLIATNDIRKISNKAQKLTPNNGK